APIEGAEAFIEPVSAPSNWKDEAKIAAYVAEKTAERVSGAGLDLDLARITAIGLWDDADTFKIHLCRDEDAERFQLAYLAEVLDGYQRQAPTLITYNGFAFDLPLLMRRARYLGVAFPKINLDRFRSQHVDLMNELTDRDPQRRRPLGFYVKRLGMPFTKPLTGEQESQVPVTGKWAELALSVEHDIRAARRLAEFLSVIQPQPVEAEEPVL
ncbi:MAG TPA: ribonuclease H-like domain-containing protein, partial [Vicinamibacterales bacterium]|nr:ribonuclease H-like domain-containing protein [Vicinamibacterales bacterium]